MASFRIARPAAGGRGDEVCGLLPGDVRTIRTVSATVVRLPAPRAPGRAVRTEPLQDIPVHGHKRVLLAAPRGYCAGVDRAVVTVEKALERHGAPVYVRKQIVHNRHVVSDLEAKGAVFVDEVDEVPEGALVVFSAHGVAPAVKDAAAARGLHAIDATCPLVTKVHREAVRFARDDRQILLIGHTGHEEVEGTAGEAPEHVTVVTSPEEADTVVVRDPTKVVWLSQTTLSVDETMQTVRRLRERFPLLQDPPTDDICYATQNRQVAVKKVAAGADLVLVVGSANSSNTVRLAEVALQGGARTAYRIDDADEIRQEWLDGVATVGVTSGASVPDDLVHGVLAALAEAGYSDVDEVRTAEEDLIFSLPKELRTTVDGAADDRGRGGRR
jgi:4-hydroxy-3-methylbut-2-enyl diphosphate reductase